MQIIKTNDSSLVLLCEEHERDQAIAPYVDRCRQRGFGTIIRTEDGPGDLTKVTCLPFAFDQNSSQTGDTVILIDDRGSAASYKSKEFDQAVSFDD